MKPFAGEFPALRCGHFELTSDEIWELVTYLQSLSGTVSEEVVGDVAAGSRVFVEKGACLACHEVNGQGGRLGPDLSAIGRWSSKALREVILNPNGREGREPNAVFVKTKDGRETRDLAKNEDTFTLQLMDMAGNVHLLEKKELSQIQHVDKSLMPEDYGKRFSAEEQQNLVAHLKSLQSRDLAKVATIPIEGGLAYDRISHSEREPHNWLTYCGGLVLAGCRDGNLVALESRTGKLLWHFQMGAAIGSSAISYGVDGHQYIALCAGSVLYSLALPEALND